jgi:ribosomal protein S18 acetylase RimI-like enzyme
MVELTQALRTRGQIIYPIAADLYEELADPEVQLTARLWENDRQELVGFVYVNRWQNMVDVFNARWFTPSIETELVNWAMTAVKRRNQEKNQNLPLDASALESDHPRQAFLERNGFIRLEETSILMSRPLDDPIPAAQLPPGFTIRPLAGKNELAAYVALHRAAFGTENMTEDYRLTIMSAPDYLPELDLVAVAPNGELAAFCLCQIFPDDVPRAGGKQEGWTDPLGTHPDYQRLGLAKALILTGMRLLKARGVDTALLGTSSENLVLQRAAEAVGFRRAAVTMWYSKGVDALSQASL